jgi:sugar (pentulose or hexulose) kinase
MQRAYLGIDVGTQSIRVMAVNADGSVLASASQPLTSHRDGKRHEQNPNEWWTALCRASRAVMQQLTDVEIAGLAVDATSGTILLMNRNGSAVTPALMYDDGRAAQEAVTVQIAGEELWTSQSYRMQASWALPKLLWLQGSGAVTADTKLAHQNDYIHARLAGHMLPTDSSNALKTGLDLQAVQWPLQIIDTLDIDPSVFPEVVLPGTLIGTVGAEASTDTGIPAHTPIVAGMTDGCAAQIASGAIACGSWNSVIGTTLVMKGVTENLLHDPLGVIYSHRSADGKWLPGGASSTGAGYIAQNFPKEKLNHLNTASLRSGAIDTVIYPLAGTGERYPFTVPEAHSFTLGNPANEEERFTATLQGIAYIERLAVDALRQIGANMDGRFTISGGASKSDALNQFRADILQRVLHVPAVTEGAFGMAVLAAAQESTLADAASRMVRIEKTIEPQKGFAPHHGSYHALINNLHARGWLSSSLADYTKESMQ